MALVLTRRTGETIHIGDDVTITVTEVTDSNKVRLAIDAPREIAVHRKEIYQRIQREKAAQCTGNGNRCDKCKGHPEFCPEEKPCAA